MALEEKVDVGEDVLSRNQCLTDSHTSDPNEDVISGTDIEDTCLDGNRIKKVNFENNRLAEDKVLKIGQEFDNSCDFKSCMENLARQNGFVVAVVSSKKFHVADRPEGQTTHKSLRLQCSLGGSQRRKKKQQPKEDSVDSRKCIRNRLSIKVGCHFYVQGTYMVARGAFMITAGNFEHTNGCTPSRGQRDLSLQKEAKLDGGEGALSRNPCDSLADSHASGLNEEAISGTDIEDTLLDENRITKANVEDNRLAENKFLKIGQKFDNSCDFKSCMENLARRNGFVVAVVSSKKFHVADRPEGQTTYKSLRLQCSLGGSRRRKKKRQPKEGTVDHRKCNRNRQSAKVGCHFYVQGTYMVAWGAFMVTAGNFEHTNGCTPSQDQRDLSLQKKTRGKECVPQDTMLELARLSESNLSSREIRNIMKRRLPHKVRKSPQWYVNAKMYLHRKGINLDAREHDAANQKPTFEDKDEGQTKIADAEEDSDDENTEGPGFTAGSKHVEPNPIPRSAALAESPVSDESVMQRGGEITDTMLQTLCSEVISAVAPTPVLAQRFYQILETISNEVAMNKPAAECLQPHSVRTLFVRPQFGDDDVTLTSKPPGACSNLHMKRKRSRRETGDHVDLRPSKTLSRPGTSPEYKRRIGTITKKAQRSEQDPKSKDAACRFCFVKEKGHDRRTCKLRLCGTYGHLVNNKEVWSILSQPTDTIFSETVSTRPTVTDICSNKSIRSYRHMIISQFSRVEPSEEAFCKVHMMSKNLKTTELMWITLDQFVKWGQLKKKNSDGDNIICDLFVEEPLLTKLRPLINKTSTFGSYKDFQI